MSPQPRPTSSSPVRSRERPFTVGEVLRQVRDCLEDNFLPLLVRGEVADLRRPRGGNIYFSLRDARARLRVVAFASTLRRVPHTLENGADALVWGRISAYPPSGDVQLIAEHFEPAGLGARHQELERLRKRLAAEGLFAAERKRPLPWVPRSVGVVTSPTGSAIHDVRTTLARRFPGLRVVLSPSRVNGAECAPQLVRALRALDERGGVDVILVVRGGGSREDLAGFDDEAVVRAVAACRTPVVSGVGHEDDVTLVDLVADRRAPTPTGAAELAVPVREELLAELDRRGRRMRVAVNRRLEDARARLHHAARRHGLHAPAVRLARSRDALAAAAARLERAHPRAALAARRERLANLGERLERASPRHALPELAARLDRAEAALRQAAGAATAARRERLAAAAGRLEALSPLGVLSRGYSLTARADGRIVRRASELRPGDEVTTRLADGAFTARVERVDPEETRPHA